MGEKLTDPGKIIGIDASKEDVYQRVRHITNGWGADIIFEASGSHVAASSLPKVSFEDIAAWIAEAPFYALVIFGQLTP